MLATLGSVASALDQTLENWVFFEYSASTTKHAIHTVNPQTGVVTSTRSNITIRGINSPAPKSVSGNIYYFEWDGTTNKLYKVDKSGVHTYLRSTSTVYAFESNFLRHSVVVNEQDDWIAFMQSGSQISFRKISDNITIANISSGTYKTYLGITNSFPNEKAVISGVRYDDGEYYEEAIQKTQNTGNVSGISSTLFPRDFLISQTQVRR